MLGKYQSRITPNGDCFRAVLASLLELPLVAVPDFTNGDEATWDIVVEREKGEPDAKYEKWYLDMQQFVAQFGFVLVEIILSDRPWLPLPNEAFAIFMGPTENGEKHAIVGKVKDGRFIPVFDPMGKDCATFTAVESVAFLVPADPMTQVRMGKALETILELTRGISNRIVADAINEECFAALGKKPANAPQSDFGFGREARVKPEFSIGDTVSTPCCMGWVSQVYAPVNGTGSNVYSVKDAEDDHEYLAFEDEMEGV